MQGNPYLDQYIYNIQQATEESLSTKDRYLTPPKLIGYGIGAGFIGLTGLGIGYGIHSAHRNLMLNNERYRNFQNRLSPMAKSFSSLRENIITPFSPTLRNVDQTGFGAGRILGKYAGDISWDRLSHFVGTERTARFKVGIRGKMLRLPMAGPIFGGMTVLNEFSEDTHPSSLITGAAKFTAGTIGSAFGLKAGAAIGMFLGGPLGAIAGTLVGGALGYGAGESAIGLIQWAKSKGRQWTLPDLGGSFRDSQMGMTMRQRSLNMISTSQFNIRSALGNEAVRLNFGL